MKKAAAILGGVLSAPVLVIVAFAAATWAPDRPVSELQTRWAVAEALGTARAGVD